MPVLPFHRYVGPGNPIDSGSPVDRDDSIAREHDIKYEYAKTVKDVRQADLEAIRAFRKDWLEGNWHSLIGDAGLSFKYFIESYTGVVYPNLEKCQCSNVSLFNKQFHLGCFFSDNKSNFDEPVLGHPRRRTDRVASSPRTPQGTLTLPPRFKIIVTPLSTDWSELFIRYSRPHFPISSLTSKKPQHRVTAIKRISPLYKSDYDLFCLAFWLRLFVAIKFILTNKESLNKNRDIAEMYTNRLDQLESILL